MKTRRLIIGCGYLGARVAKIWQASGHEVHVVTRSPQRAAEFQRQGWTSWLADVTQPSDWTPIPETEAVLFAVGYDAASQRTQSEVYAGGVRNVTRALTGKTQRFVYVSSTGVYGHADGEWVDEQTPPDPRRPGGTACWEAEQAAARSPLAQHCVILRMAGLYGPGRIPFAEKLRRNEPLEAPSQGWLNLIHIDDAALIAADAPGWDAIPTEPVLARPSLPGEPLSNQPLRGPLVVCVSDGRPVLRAEYYAAAAQILGAPPPRFIAPSELAPATARAASNRRVRTDLLQRLTSHRPLLYPSYREGLTSLLAH